MASLKSALNEAITAAIDQAFRGAPLEVLCRNLRLYTGLESGLGDQEFWNKLIKAQQQKVDLGRYLCRTETKGLIRSFAWPSSQARARKVIHNLFIECGSTLCPFIGKYAATMLKEEGCVRPSTVYTNNLFAITALVHLVGHVVSVEGSFRTRYYGFFPFAEQDEAPENRPEHKVAISQEAYAYSKLCSMIESCEVVLATCSNFSFLAGPLVGRRANAISKHAMYLGKHQRCDYVLMFHVNKIIPIHDSPANGVFEPPKPSCYCIFPPPSRAFHLFDKVANLSLWHNQWRSSAPEVKNIADSFGQLFVAAPTGPRPRAISESDFKKSWSDCVQDVKILIALRGERLDDDLKAVKGEVAAANQLSTQTGVKYELVVDGDMLNKYHVVEVDMN